MKEIDASLHYISLKDNHRFAADTFGQRGEVGMGIENFEGGNSIEAAGFHRNPYETRMDEAGNFGKFEDAGFHFVRPNNLDNQRGNGPPLDYGGYSPSEMQEQFRKFYAMDQGQIPWDADTYNAFFGETDAVTVMQDGKDSWVSGGHERLRYAQETNQPYIPVHLHKINY